MKLIGMVQWLVAHWQEIVLVVGGIIAGASVLVKALEKLVALLLALFPGLKPADGELLHVAALLDGLGKSPFLNTLALSPVKEVK